MQIILSGILFLLLIAIGVIYWHVGGYRDSTNIRRLRSTMVMTQWIIVSEIAILLLRERQYVYFAFASYFLSVAWFGYFMFRFCIAHAGYGKYPFYKIPLFWLTFIASIELIHAHLNQSMYTITHMRWLGHTVWMLRRFSTLYFFTGVCLIAWATSISILIAATIRSARLYRLRYSSIIVVFLGMGLSYLMTQLKQQPIFLSVICFALGEIIVIYMAVYYAPTQLMKKALMFAADQLNDGMVLYDEEHQLQFVTDSFSKAMGLKNMQGLYDEVGYWNKMLSGIEKDDIWNGQIKSIERDGRLYYYGIQHQTFEEEGKPVGTLYWLRDITESIENYEKMIHRANYDELTGIYNEVHFHEEAQEVLQSNPDKTFIMICSNVEKFKLFRDLFGKERAQDYLKETAKNFKNGLSKIDLCRYGRIGEDGFYIMMPKESFAEEDLFREVDQITAKFNTNNYHMNVRLGIYEITDPNLPMATICNRASMVCDLMATDYHRKVLWFDEKVQREAMLMEKYNAELSEAIARGDIQVYLQPQMNREGKIIGAEALARWIHKEDGVIAPIHFIPFFEENGRITELDICIWRQACQKLKEWKERGRSDLYLSVNISAKDLYALNLFEFYMDLIKEYDISPKNLKLEITESAIINDLHQHLNLISRLQEAGFEVEMDDFGSAYSSFNMLKDICVDVLKIDMKFLGDTENIQRSRTILKSIVDLSGELHMKTVAEGVETEEQFEFLKSAGCDYYQGYYFSKPMSAEDFEKKYIL